MVFDLLACRARERRSLTTTAIGALHAALQDLALLASNGRLRICGAANADPGMFNAVPVELNAVPVAVKVC